MTKPLGKEDELQAKIVPLNTVGDQELFDEIAAKHSWDTGLDQAIGFLRQWLNEDRITDPKKLVTSEELEHWLKAAIQAYADQQTAKHLLELKKDMAMHTVPEGNHLITRSYLNHAIDFEAARLAPKEEGQNSDY